MVFDFDSHSFLDGPDLLSVRLGLWLCRWPGIGSAEGAKRLPSDVLSVVSSFARFFVPSPMSLKGVLPHVGQGGVG